MKRLKKNCFLSILFILAIAICLSFSPGTAKATAILDFNMDAIHPATAKISYNNELGRSLIGENISVDSVIGIDTPHNNRVGLIIVGGILNFETGSLTDWDSNSWRFGPGGSITITGTIPSIGLTTPTTLLTGSFLGAEIHAFGKYFKVAMGGIEDTQDEQLGGFYGVPDILCTGGLNLSFFAQGTPPNTFVSTTVLSGDVSNDPPVPEPTTMLLLGSGLIGLVGYGRRKLIK